MSSLHLRTYLSPTVPLQYTEAIGRTIEQALGISVRVTAELRRSGPPSDVRDPLTRQGIDIGLMCSPPYQWLSRRSPPDGGLLPAIHVFSDPRNQGKPHYFADVYVRSDAPYRSLEDLRGARFGYNDRCSLSGYLGMERILADRKAHPSQFFSALVPTGGHAQSIEKLSAGAIDVCTIDSNAAHTFFEHGVPSQLRMLCGLGPFPVQPFVCRPGLDVALIREIADTLLATDGDYKAYGVTCFVPCDDSLFRTGLEQRDETAR